MRLRFHASIVVCFATAAPLLLTPANARADDPTTSDCLTANETSIKLRADHRLREARAQLLICAATSCPADIRNACMQKVGKVNDAIPTVVFEVRDANDNELAAVAVTMDGQPLVSRLEGTAISLDPGEHVFGFEAAGHARVEKRLIIHEGEKDRRERVVLGAALVAPSAPAPPPAPSPPPPSAAAPPAPPPLAAALPAPQIAQPPTVVPPAQPATSPAPPGSSGLGTQRVLGLSMAAAGLVGLGIGTGFGLMASSAWNNAIKACGGDTTYCADLAAGTSYRNTTETDGLISTVGFVAGGLLVAAGAVVFLSGGRHEGSPAAGMVVTPTAGPGFAGVSLEGAFR